MKRFEPCDCLNHGCFRCAVGFVIADLGFDLQCECFEKRGKPCANRCGRMHSIWVSAFRMATVSSGEWARRRADKAGQKIVKVVINRHGVDEDVTDAVLAGAELPPHTSVYSSSKMDLGVAADKLASEFEADPISFDAARIVIARIIELGDPVPSSLRKLAAELIRGTAIRPAKGKIRGATETRDRMIFLLIKDVIEATGLHATSSEGERGIGACNAVAEGLRLLGCQPNSYSQIVQIWRRRDELKGFSSSWD